MPLTRPVQDARSRRRRTCLLRPAQECRWDTRCASAVRRSLPARAPVQPAEVPCEDPPERSRRQPPDEDLQEPDDVPLIRRADPRAGRRQRCTSTRLGRSMAPTTARRRAGSARARPARRRSESGTARSDRSPSTATPHRAVRSPICRRKTQAGANSCQSSGFARYAKTRSTGWSTLALTSIRRHMPGPSLGPRQTHDRQGALARLPFPTALLLEAAHSDPAFRRVPPSWESCPDLRPDSEQPDPE